MTVTHRSATRPAVCLLAAATLLLTGCSGEPAPPPSPVPVTAEPRPDAPGGTETAEPTALLDYGVSAGHPAAVEAGMSILAAGGNAVDAAVAAAFAIAVVEPFASGIGGGGSAIVAPTGGEPRAYDYREVVAQDGRIPASGTGIPGFVAGMGALHADYGTMAWGELLQPAITLARDGFPVSDFLALRMDSDYGPGAVSGLPHFAPGGKPLDAGQTLVQADLARTMTTIADGGPAAFYTGPLAAELATVDGVDPVSLAAYEVVRAEPVRGSFAGYEVLAAPPALPGVALVQMLQVAEAAGIGETTPGSAAFIERLSAAWQVADRSVADHLGDPAFVDVPVAELTDPARNAELAASGGGDAAAAAGPGSAVVPGNTTHLTVVDTDGLMVSMTNTITSFWGGGEAQMVAGFFLNNQLSRFEAIDTPANQPAPGRRSVSWSAPTVVLDDAGRPVLGLGSPGGRQIPNILANVLVRWGLHDQALADAVAAERFHLEGSTLTVEQVPDDVGALRRRGWRIEPVRVEDAVFGSVQSLEIDQATGRVTGAVDTRREADTAIATP